MPDNKNFLKRKYKQIKIEIKGVPSHTNKIGGVIVEPIRYDLQIAKECKGFKLVVVRDCCQDRPHIG